jgi:hypothetical protein
MAVAYLSLTVLPIRHATFSETILTHDACRSLVARVEDAWAKQQFTLDSTPTKNTKDNNQTSMTLADSVRAGSRSDDFKLVLHAQELRDAVGKAAYDTLVAMLNRSERLQEPSAQSKLTAVPDVIVLRRTQATHRWIGFHTDRALRTVQVPLMSDSKCVGGQLVFACPDGTWLPVARKAGVPIAHDGHVVHGVSKLEAGTRYGLFLLREVERN